ncbi:hypothetical protein HDU97_004194 [Phlyctochytrium planicorne]|nr:hypothetical protein HDU97_004194 [Phlyctochytrium planicorne]
MFPSTTTTPSTKISSSSSISSVSSSSYSDSQTNCSNGMSSSSPTHFNLEHPHLQSESSGIVDAFLAVSVQEGLNYDNDHTTINVDNNASPNSSMELPDPMDAVRAHLIAEKNKDSAMDFKRSALDVDTITAVTTPASNSADQSKTPSKASKLVYFEGLRGVAALWVVFIHTMHYFTTLDNWLRLYQHWFTPVPIFFILSGGIITRSIMQSNADKKSTHEELLQKLFSSFIRRPFRLLIPLYFGSLYKMMLIKYFGLKIDFEHDLPENWSVFFRDPIRFMIYGDGMEPYIPFAFMPVPAWTLHPEFLGSMVIYMLTAILLPYATNSRVKYTTLFIMFLFFFFSDNLSFYFLIGYFLADLTISGYTAKFNAWRYKHLVKIILLLVAVGITYEFSDLQNETDKTVMHPNPIRAQLLEFFRVTKIRSNTAWKFPINSLVMFYCATVFFLIETTPFLQKCLSIPPVTYLGRISFMLYLLHQDTAIAMTPLTEKWIFAYGTAGYWAKFLFDTGVCILIADVATRMFDEPLQKIAKRTERFIMQDKWYILPVRQWPGFLMEKVCEFPVFVGSRVKGACMDFWRKVVWFTSGQVFVSMVSAFKECFGKQ